MDDQSGASKGPLAGSSGDGASRIQERRSQDQALTALHKAGDARAFGRLFDAWFDAVHDRIVNRGVSSRDAADIEIKVFGDMWKRLQKSGSADAFGVSALRATRKHVPKSSAPGKPAGPTGEDSLTRGTDRMLLGKDRAVTPLLWDAAEVLGDRPREVLDLTVRHGLTSDEIASVIGDKTENIRKVEEKLPIGFGTTVRARILWRGGKPEHKPLANALKDKGDSFNSDVVRTINDHLKSCDQCRARAMIALAPLEVFASIPVAIAPTGLKEKVASALVASGVDMSGSKFVNAEELAEAAKGGAAKGGEVSAASTKAAKADQKSEDSVVDPKRDGEDKPAEKKPAEKTSSEKKPSDKKSSDKNVEADDSKPGKALAPLALASEGKEGGGESEEPAPTKTGISPVVLGGMGSGNSDGSPANDGEDGGSGAKHKPVESSGAPLEIPKDDRRPWKLIIGAAAAVVIIGAIIAAVALGGSDKDEVATGDTVLRNTTTTQDPSKTTTTTRPTTTTSSTTTTTEPTDTDGDGDPDVTTTTVAAPGGGGGGGGGAPSTTTTTTHAVQSATASISINGQGVISVGKGTGDVQVSWSATSNGPISVIVRGNGLNSGAASGSQSVCPGEVQGGGCPGPGVYSYTISIFDGKGALIKAASAQLQVN